MPDKDYIDLKGRELIKAKLIDAPHLPGVYQMFGENTEVLYIGKAKNLRRRLSSYTKPAPTRRIGTMITATRSLEYIICDSEAHALITEAQLIKKKQPKFNILLKDDKSFPFIKLRLDHKYPQLMKFRGKKLVGGDFFGPFASVDQVDKTLSEIQKIFKLRTCSDPYFAARARPCLQYQIKRCSAPCCDKISEIDYKKSVTQAKQFMQGKTSELQKSLSSQMQEYSTNLEFEKAAAVRDKIKALSYVQLKSGTGSDIALQKHMDIDVIAAVSSVDLKGEGYKTSMPLAAVQVFMYRAGQSFGGKCYFPSHKFDAEIDEILSSFIGQFYQSRMPASEIIISHKISGAELLSKALEMLHGKKVKISSNCRTSKAKLLQHAKTNGIESLKLHIKSTARNNDAMVKIKDIFKLEHIPERIELYDNSHIMGSFAVGAMVVAGRAGFDKKEYRIFNIKQDEIKAGGDDYAMLRQVLARRLKRIEAEPAKKPDLMIIDGGPGHMSAAQSVTKKMGYDIKFVCMSKGLDRNAGREVFHMPGHNAFSLDNNNPTMKYLQIMRDEVHNFAIKAHRRRRSKAIKISTLDQIDSIGQVRKRQLLEFFGSFREISKASVDEISRIDNFDKKLAQKIYDALHKKF